MAPMRSATCSSATTSSAAETIVTLRKACARPGRGVAAVPAKPSVGARASFLAGTVQFFDARLASANAASHSSALFTSTQRTRAPAAPNPSPKEKRSPAPPNEPLPETANPFPTPEGSSRSSTSPFGNISHAETANRRRVSVRDVSLAKSARTTRDVKPGRSRSCAPPPSPKSALVLPLPLWPCATTTASKPLCSQSATSRHIASGTPPLGATPSRRYRRARRVAASEDVDAKSPSFRPTTPSPSVPARTRVSSGSSTSRSAREPDPATGSSTARTTSRRGWRAAVRLSAAARAGAGHTEQ